MKKPRLHGFSCRVTHCVHPVTGYGVYCSTHRTRDKRHGHPEQPAITSAALKPHRKRLRDWIARREAETLWEALEAAQGTLTRFAEGELRAYQRGEGTRNLWHREACLAIASVAQSAAARVIVETVLSMVMMREYDPRLFMSDKAFRYQLGRRFRALSRGNVGRGRKGTSSATTTYLTNARPRSLEVLGRYLEEALGAAGLNIARTMEKEREEHALASQQLWKAIQS